MSASIPFGKTVRGFKTTSSTQDEARRLVEAEGASVAGQVMMTSNQTAGRGRQGRTWYAPPGANLCQTIIGGPVPLADLWQLPFVIGIASHDALRQIVPDIDIRLKFPNDVQVGGKKVAGILVETATGPDVPKGTAMPLIGVGVNVHGGVDALPPEVAVRATTLEAATGKSISVGLVGGTLTLAVKRRWEEWRTGAGFEKTLVAWREQFDPDARRVFVLNGESVSCRVRNISLDGYAVVERPDGSQFTVPIPQIVLG